MGSNLAKRIAELRSQADLDSTRRLGFFKTLLSVVAVFALVSVGLSAVLPSTESPSSPSVNRATLSEAERVRYHRTEIAKWQSRLEEKVEDRYYWLDNFLYGDFFAEQYFAYSRSVANALRYVPSVKKGDAISKSVNRLVNFDSWLIWCSQFLTEAFLCVGFMIIAFWPLWIIGTIVGFILGRKIVKPKLNFDILGVCHRKNGPFYSGIYGPFRPNHGPSATNYSCPSLACPDRISNAEALRHPTAQLLRQYGALNETNLELLGVVLAYHDYPAFAEVHKPSEDEGEESVIADESCPSLSGYVTNETGTIENSTRKGLSALLKSHKVLQSYFSSKPKDFDVKNLSYNDYHSEISSSVEGLGANSKVLLLTLTPQRAYELSKLPSRLVASAYLAIEAGKSLVFKRVDKGFTQISQFPHLQARAVIQSLAPYHKEYDGDSRMIIRQAIICSKRHEDFGRAFLPNRMLASSRALRDLLEIMYDHPDKRQGTAHLVELDSHIEEISSHFRKTFTDKVIEVHEKEENGKIKEPASLMWKGIVHKSVVLVPLENVLRVALSGVDKQRKDRVSDLLQQTKNRQANLSISARLPGFKRQAQEAEESGIQSGNTSETLASLSDGKDLLAQWLIVRRMLTRYNWLSTRVGDDAVPSDGLVQGLVVDRKGGNKPHVIGLEALVPLRQRRFKEMFGPRWEHAYYQNMPHHADIEVFVNTKDFSKALKERMDQAEKGLLSRRPSQKVVGED